MRFPRVRFTVRRIMAVVAVIGLVLGVSIEAFRLKRQRDTFLKLAAEHEDIEKIYRQAEQFNLEMAQLSESSFAMEESFRTKVDERIKAGSELRSRAIQSRHERDDRLTEFARKRKEAGRQNRLDAAVYHRSAMYHGTLKQKYRAAAARPWRSIEPDPPPPGLSDRAMFWSERGNHGQAVAAYEELLERDPDDQMALNGLAWLLATSPDASLRDGKRAIELAAGACEWSNWSEPSFLDTLAAAYAEAGDFAHAVAMQNKAIASLPAGSADVSDYRERLQLYQNKKPYREPVSVIP